MILVLALLLMPVALAKYESKRLKRKAVAINDGDTRSGIDGVVINNGGTCIDIGIGVAIDNDGATQI